MTARVTRRAALAGLLGVVTVGVAPAVAAAAPALRVGDLVTDPCEVRALRIYRAMSPAQREAWLRMAHRIVAGVPVRRAGYLMHRELGCSPADALARVNEVLDARGKVLP